MPRLAGMASDFGRDLPSGGVVAIRADVLAGVLGVGQDFGGPPIQGVVAAGGHAGEAAGEGAASGAGGRLWRNESLQVVVLQIVTLA